MLCRDFCACGDEPSSKFGKQWLRWLLASSGDLGRNLDADSFFELTPLVLCVKIMGIKNSSWILHIVLGGDYIVRGLEGPFLCLR